MLGSIANVIAILGWMLVLDWDPDVLGCEPVVTSTRVIAIVVFIFVSIFIRAVWVNAE